MDKKNYEEWLKDELDVRVWRALEDVASDYPCAPDDMHQRCMRRAIEHFMTEFYSLDEDDE